MNRKALVINDVTEGRGHWSDSIEVFMPLSHTLTARLLAALSDAGREFARQPRRYLRHTLLPDPLGEWLPWRLTRVLQQTLAAYAATPRGHRAPCELDQQERWHRRRLGAGLVCAVLVHLGLGLVISLLPPLELELAEPSEMGSGSLIKLRLVSPPAAQVPAPPRQVKIQPKRSSVLLPPQTPFPLPAMATPTPAATITPTPQPSLALTPTPTPDQARLTALGKELVEKANQISEAQLKEALGRAYARYSASAPQELGVFALTATFVIKPDGTLTQIMISEPSGIAALDEQAPDFLQALSQTRVFWLFTGLTATSLRLVLSETTAELTLHGVAKQTGEAQALANLLGFVQVGASRSDRPAHVKALLQGLAARSDQNQLIIRLRLPRQRAAELLRTQFGDYLPPSKPPG